jgi:hypothetical protein
MRIKCPSGLEGTIRKLKVAEANMLAGAKAQKGAQVMDSLLSAVWEETHEVGGAVIDEATGNPVWSKCLTADRFYALLMIRVATYGPEYGFNINCESCRSTIKWELDLTDLPVQALEDESVKNFINGNKFSVTIGNNTFIFGLMTGEAEAKAAKVLKASSDKITATLLSRVSEIDGVHFNERRKVLTNLDLDEALELLDECEAVDGGVETNIEVECPECGALNEVSLPLGRDFWLPRKARKRI